MSMCLSIYLYVVVYLDTTMNSSLRNVNVASSPVQHLSFFTEPFYMKTWSCLLPFYSFIPSHYLNVHDLFSPVLIGTEDILYMLQQNILHMYNMCIHIYWTSSCFSSFKEVFKELRPKCKLIRKHRLWFFSA
jgi:hypothetical protein